MLYLTRASFLDFPRFTQHTPPRTTWAPQLRKKYVLFSLSRPPLPCNSPWYIFVVDQSQPRIRLEKPATDLRCSCWHPLGVIFARLAKLKCSPFAIRDFIDFQPSFLSFPIPHAPSYHQLQQHRAAATTATPTSPHHHCTAVHISPPRSWTSCPTTFCFFWVLSFFPLPVCNFSRSEILHCFFP